MSEIELKACPFCGPGQSVVGLWHDDVAQRWRVGCGRCGCSTGISPRDKTEPPAIKAWNERAPQWQPIESAPKDGTPILLGYFNSAGNWRTLRGRWFSAERIEMEWENADDFDAGWYEESVEADDIPNVWPTTPSHWQPLPAPPEVEG